MNFFKRIVKFLPSMQQVRQGVKVGIRFGIHAIVNANGTGSIGIVAADIAIEVGKQPVTSFLKRKLEENPDVVINTFLYSKPVSTVLPSVLPVTYFAKLSNSDKFIKLGTKVESKVSAFIIDNYDKLF